MEKANKSTRISTEEFLEEAKDAVVTYWDDAETDFAICAKNVIVVWYCKTLQNHKAILAVNISGDHSLYEATYNGDTSQIYLDAYVKKANASIWNLRKYERD